MVASVATIFLALCPWVAFTKRAPVTGWTPPESQNGRALLQISRPAPSAEHRERELDRKLGGVKDGEQCDWSVYYDLWVPTFDKGEYRHNGPLGGAHCLVACCADPTCLGVALESSEEYQCYRYSHRPELLDHKSSRPIDDAKWLKTRPKRWSIFMKGPAMPGKSTQRTDDRPAGSKDAEQPENAQPVVASAAEKKAVAQSEATAIQSALALYKLMDVREFVQVAVLVSAVLAMIRIVSGNAIVLKLIGQKFALGHCDEAKRLLKKQGIGTGAAAQKEQSIADAVVNAFTCVEEPKLEAPGVQLAECVDPVGGDLFDDAEKVLKSSDMD